MSTAFAAAASLILSAPLLAQDAPSTAPALTGQGTLSDSEGHSGRWAVNAAAQGNALHGILLVEIAGRRLQLDLGTANSYRENGRCYVRGEAGRDRIELARPCDAQPFAGSLRGFLDGIGTISGQFTGRLAATSLGAISADPAPARAAAPAPAQAAKSVPMPAPKTGPFRPVAVNANSGPFTGRGTLATSDGESGTWQVSGTLAKGLITGSLSATVGARAMTVDLGQGRAYMENGFCVMKGVDGRNRFNLRGRCDQEPFTGTINGYFDGVGEVNGTSAGSLTWGRPQSAAATGVLPTGKLLCSYMERMGGVVAGDLGTREIRPSALGSLTLSGGRYVARNGSGSFVQEGATIRLTSGPWAGARGRLMPDGSGVPAVYFELDDNRRPDGSYIVDPWRTFCTRPN